MMQVPHSPVMLQEVLENLMPRDGAVFVDGTFGRGGYTKGLLDSAKCKVFAIDQDPDAIAFGKEILLPHYTDRLTLIAGKFGDMLELLEAHNLQAVDGIVFDLGVSSPQLDEAERGFSFTKDGPLDMRMGQSGRTAADIINSYDEEPLANVIYNYGDERRSRAIAKAIVKARTESPITRTLQLAEIVRRVYGRTKEKIDPATRTFQALRIYVNDELGELDRGLAAAERLLAPGGRLVVVSFHSLEDRRVKTFLKTRSGADQTTSRLLPGEQLQFRTPSFTLLSRKSLLPKDSEIAANPRSRSAKMRVAERTNAPAWPQEVTA